MWYGKAYGEDIIIDECDCVIAKNVEKCDCEAKAKQSALKKTTGRTLP